MAQVDNIIGYVKGPQGDAASIAVGNVTTGDPGTNASVTNRGTSSAAVLDFQIPKGTKGDAGTPGVTDYATTSAAGLVRVGDDFNINASTGALSIKDAFIEASTLANINTGESHATILGKIKKFMSTLMPSNFLINTVNSTSAEKALTANMGHTLAGDFATVQTSATASKAYSVGEYLVLNGKLYKVTRAIANGGTITVGTNVSAVTVGTQLTALNNNLNSFLTTYSFNGVVPNGTNIDTIGTPGMYFISGNYDYINLPISGRVAAYLEVIRAYQMDTMGESSAIVQRLTTTTAVFFRHHGNNAWLSWQRTVNQSSDNELIQKKLYEYEYTIPANGTLGVTANQLGLSTPTNYTILGLYSLNTNNQYVVPRGFLLHQTGDNNAVFLKNLSASPVTASLTARVSYIRSVYTSGVA